MSVFVLLGTSVQLFVILLKSGLSSWKSIMTCLTILGEQLLFRGAISRKKTTRQDTTVTNLGLFFHDDYDILTRLIVVSDSGL